MTWVLGTNSLMSNANLVSDVCITFTKGNGTKEYVDCLQKIYNVGNFVIAGFAGSVKIGLTIIEYLHEALSHTSPEAAWNMEIIANTWLPRKLKRIYKLSPDNEKKLRCSILVGSADPVKNNGDGPFALTYIHKFESPDFTPKKALFNEVFSIGSGKSIEDYTKAVNRIKNNSDFLKMSVMSNQPYAFSFAHEIRRIVEEQPQLGISKYFQAGAATRGKVDIVNTFINRFTDNGEIKDDFPKLVAGYAAFYHFCKHLGIRAEGAIA